MPSSCVLVVPFPGPNKELQEREWRPDSVGALCLRDSIGCSLICYGNIRVFRLQFPALSLFTSPPPRPLCTVAWLIGPTLLDDSHVIASRKLRNLEGLRFLQLLAQK